MLKKTILGFFLIFSFILLRNIDAGACLGRSVSESELPPGGSVHRIARNVDETRRRRISGNNHNADNEPEHDSSSWHFGYRNIAEWGKHYPECNGKKQSPVDLNSSLMYRLKVSQPFQWTGYRRSPKNMTVVNNGHTEKLFFPEVNDFLTRLDVTVQLSGYWHDKNIPHISGGSLTGDYIFHQLHFHWGTRDDTGSEHTVNNISLPLEMHMVHYKKSYGSLDEAMKFEDGLAVVGILYRVETMGNTGIHLMQNNFEAVKLPGGAMSIRPFPLSKFHLNFPDEYVSYVGSLTTPPCSEIVTWIIPAVPRLINRKQIDVFRRINLSGGDDHNNRPIMPLNGRMLYYIEC